ncbi:MAG: class I SAM-dependent methyltransferase [Candidatus Hydrogenedentes bacterium]|nr:class I SAM-dependent methyltransferase [Candidatus Hydrogenedentota bacterium]
MPFRSMLIAGLVSMAGLSAYVYAGDEAAKAERKPAPVMSHEGVDWLERPERDKEEQPDVVLKAMSLRDGNVVVDLGCGSGYFSRRLAKSVAPSGKVYAVDIQAEFLEELKKRCKQEDITNVEPVLGTEDDPKVAPGIADWVLLVDVYHEFQQPSAMLAKIHALLKPEGRVALVEYRLEGDSANHIKLEHRMSVEQVTREWKAAGFVLAQLIESLPSQHLFLFKKAAAPSQ